MLKPGRKKLDEIFMMSEKELMQYLKEIDNTLQLTDSIQILTSDLGIKALYFHQDSTKPYKTRVFLRNV